MEPASFSAAALAIAAAQWPGPPPDSFWVRGQIVARRKVARGLIFFSLRDEQHDLQPEPEPEPEPPQQLGGRAAAVDVVISAHVVDAAMLELAKGLRAGDCVEVLGVLEEAAAGQQQKLSVQARGGSCLAVVSRWADTHGRLTFAAYTNGGKNRSQLLAAAAAGGIGEEDRAVVLASVQQSGRALCYASAALRDDEGVCLAAVSQSGGSLQHASARMRGTFAVALAAVSQNGASLQFASAAMRAHREVAAAAIRQSGAQALAHCAPELLQQHPELASLGKVEQSSVDPTRKQTRAREVQQAAEEVSKDGGSTGEGEGERDSSRLWERRAGWHDASSSNDVGVDEIRGALRCCSASASAGGSQLAACGSCGGSTHLPCPPPTACWACGPALEAVLQLAVSSGGLNRHAKAVASGTCRDWRRAVFVSRIPGKLDSKGAGRKWLQGWYHAFERQIAGVPTAVGVEGVSLPSVDVNAGKALHRALNEVVNNGKNQAPSRIMMQCSDRAERYP